MVDNIVTERWNLIGTADMALRVKGILQRVMAKKPHPKDFKASLNEGIAFLNQASTGGAIISGTPVGAGSFEGTLSPLCWAADVHFGFPENPPENKKAVYEKLVQTLNDYKSFLESLIKQSEEDYEKLGQETVEVKNVSKFFDSLVDVLIPQLDPTVTQYSHQID